MTPRNPEIFIPGRNQVTEYKVKVDQVPVVVTVFTFGEQSTGSLNLKLNQHLSRTSLRVGLYSV
jgi:hypothetical protein